MALHGRRLKVYFPEPLDEKLKGYWTIEDVDFKGLFNFAVRSMGFTFDPVVQSEPSIRLPNGTWTGTVGLLNRSEVDLASTLMAVTEDRWDALSFNYPYFVDDVTFVARKPRYDPEIMALGRTLSPGVWLSLLVSTLLVALVCVVVWRHRCALEDVLLDVLAVGLNQEGRIVPKTSGEVLLLFSWLVGMALFTTCFKSVLLSFLTLPPLSGVRTVPELAAAIRAGKYRTISMKNHLARHLQGSPNEDVRLIAENMLLGPPGSMDDLLDKGPGGSVFVYVRSRLTHAQEMLYVSGDSMGHVLGAPAASKDFCCKDLMDMTIHRFLAAGIHEKINRFVNYRWAFDLSKKLPDDGRAVRRISMTDVMGAFILLVAGQCLSACVLVIEWRVKQREKHHTQL